MAKVMEQMNEKNKKKKGRVCIFTNEQLNYISKHILEEGVEFGEYSVEPNKVLAVKSYLDETFVRGRMPIVGEDGYPQTLYIVGMKGSDGKVIKNMTAKQLFFLLQDKFSKIYQDKKQRNKFLKKVMQDRYNRKITREGLLSSNRY